MIRNPPWTRDELILALDLYFRINPSRTSSDNPEIVELSQFLNQLPIHTDRPETTPFRNPNGVYMKLSNFLSLDENYKGKGLTKGSRLDEEVWNKFSSDRELLAKTSLAIRTNYKHLNPKDTQTIDPTEEFLEGRVLTKIHTQKERNSKATKKKKALVLTQTGHLVCEVCGFDFFKVYGKLGQGFAECHHKKPIAELDAETSTRLDDLAIVCANCHRMLHKSKPMLTIDELQQIIVKHKKQIT